MTSPRNVFRGVGAISAATEEICKRHAGERVLVLISSVMRARRGARLLLEEIARESDLAVQEVEGEPTTERIDALARTFCEQPPSVIIALGGGSVLDTAKALSGCLGSQASSLELLDAPEAIRRTAMLYAIPTTAGSGSEVTNISILTHGTRKRGLVSDAIVPDMVVLDPSFLQETPLALRLYTLLDTTGHAIEASWSKDATDVTDMYAADSLGRITHRAEEYLSYDQWNNLELLCCFQTASMHAGCAFTVAGCNVVHALAYALVDQQPLSHGKSVGMALLPTIAFFEEHRKIVPSLASHQRWHEKLLRLYAPWEHRVYQGAKPVLDIDRAARTTFDNQRLMSHFPDELSEDVLRRLLTSINERITTHTVK